VAPGVVSQVVRVVDAEDVEDGLRGCLLARAIGDAEV
jgi:hypothetical protein